MFRKHQPSLMRQLSPRTLCLILQDLPFHDPQPVSHQYQQLHRAKNKSYPPHNAALLVGPLKESGKRGRCLAANHAPKCSISSAEMANVHDLRFSTCSQIQRAENAAIPSNGCGRVDSCGGYFLHKMLNSTRKYSPQKVHPHRWLTF